MGSKKAVVLSSGGIDSTTVMAVAAKQGFQIYSLSFRYGQRHQVELEAAQKVSAALGAQKHLVIDINPAVFGGSALTDNIEVPKGRSDAEMTAEIPVTYVPARNTIFLSYALAWAEVLEACDIFIGVTAVDYSGYPDCRPEFIAAFEVMANLATKAGVEGKNIRIHAPLLYLAKSDIIKLGLILGVDYSLTHSCYDPGPAGEACGECDTCKLRLKGFRDLGIEDPVRYKK